MRDVRLADLPFLIPAGRSIAGRVRLNRRPVELYP